MTNEAQENQAKIAEVKRRMLAKELTYEEAKLEAQPTIDRINAKAAEIAKKYNKRAKKLNFSEIMR
jgi:hypothetical protein